MQGTQVQSLGQEDPLGKCMSTHSSIPAWRIPGQRSLPGCSPWDHKESDMTEWLTLYTLRGYLEWVHQFINLLINLTKSTHFLHFHQHWELLSSLFPFQTGNAQILRLPTKRRHTGSNHNNIIPYIKLYQIVSHPLRSKSSLNYIANIIIEKWCLSWLRLPLKNTIVWGGLNNRNLFLPILEAENSKIKTPM